MTVQSTNRFSSLSYNDLSVLLGVFESFANGDVSDDMDRIEQRIDREISPKEDPEHAEFDMDYIPPDSAYGIYTAMRNELREAFRAASRKRAEE